MTAETIKAAAERGAREGEEPDTDEEPDTEADTDTEPDTDDEPEPGDEPEAAAAPAPLTEAQVEAMFKALEREAARHAREVEKRAGPMFADLTPCPCCTDGPGTAGYIVAQLPEPDQTLRRQAVAQALGADAPLPLKEAEDEQMCEACDGWGRLAHPTRVPEQQTKPCPRCGGTGHVMKMALAPTPAPLALPQAAPQPTLGGGDSSQAADVWGRPFGHVHYGQHPALVSA